MPLITFAALLVALATYAQTPGGDPAAKRLKNPVPSTTASVNAGATTFKTYCALCHGTDAKGNGPLAPPNSNPPNLVDATWVHGSSDGEIFNVIVNGPGSATPGVPPKMAAFKGLIPDKDIWNVVNYLRSLGPKTAPR
jgi:mono/diheme cytochrome c family protein